MLEIDETDLASRMHIPVLGQIEVVGKNIKLDAGTC